MWVFGQFPVPLILTFLNCQRPEIVRKLCQIYASASFDCAICNWTSWTNDFVNPGVLWRLGKRDGGKNNGTSSAVSAAERSCEAVLTMSGPISGI